jgi:hypothetical protein
LSAAASSSHVIANKKTLIYGYIVMKKQDTITWKIRQHHRFGTILEDKDNKKDLESFKKAVDDFHLNIIHIILSIIYLVVSVIAVRIFLKKRSENVSQRDAILIILPL